MAITRLQQARQMYALGQRVAKTMDGSRPGYRGSDLGGSSYDPYGGAGNPGDDNKSNDRPETTRYNPHTDSGYSKTSVATGDQMRSAKRDFIQTLNTNNAIRAAQTGKKFSPYDGGSMFAPTQNRGFGILDLALLAASGGLLGPKIATGAKMFNTGKFAYDKAKQIGGLLETIGLTDKNVIDSFTDNLSDLGKGTSKKTTVTNNDRGNGEGVASLENQASNYNEYILLLQKLQAGTISDAERNRYNVLKNMLGI